MKKLVSMASVLVVLLFLQINETLHHTPINIIRSEPTEVEKFMYHIAIRESNNNLNATNKFGMLGKYQFDPATIKMLGFNISNIKFLNNSKLQDSVMLANMKLNNRELNFIIKKYEGTIVKGIKITRAGILAAAHLAGPFHVLEFFRSDDINGRTDANGTSIRDYILIFGKHNLTKEKLL